MGILYALTISLVLWVVLWAFGAKGFDAFMPFFLIMTVAVALRLVRPHLPGHKSAR